MRAPASICGHSRRRSRGIDHAPACSRRASTIRWAARCPTRRRPPCSSCSRGTTCRSSRTTFTAISILAGSGQDPSWRSANRATPLLQLVLENDCARLPCGLAGGGALYAESTRAQARARRSAVRRCPGRAGRFPSSGGYDHHLRRIRRTFEHSIEQMTRTIDSSFPTGTRVSRPTGGFVLWLELPRPLRTRELFAAALDKGICFAPGDAFSASNRYANCLRLSCGHPWDSRIERSVITLGALASAALSRHHDRRSA